VLETVQQIAVRRVRFQSEPRAIAKEQQDSSDPASVSAYVPCNVQTADARNLRVGIRSRMYGGSLSRIELVLVVGFSVIVSRTTEGIDDRTEIGGSHETRAKSPVLVVLRLSGCCDAFRMGR